MLKKSLVTQCALMALFTLVLLWTVPATADHHIKAADAVKSVYICGCGPACGCNMMAEKPGTCPCGKPMIEKQVLKEDADKVYVCACGDGCKCAPDQADPTKCACGKELRAYPKVGKAGCANAMQGGCAHAMQGGCAHAMQGGCDSPCCARQPASAK
jgi:hypothetical protein